METIFKPRANAKPYVAPPRPVIHTAPVEDDAMVRALAAMVAAREGWQGPVAPLPEAERRVYLFGIQRDPIPGAVRAPGTRRQPQPYKFIGGKRVSTAPAKRWGVTR